MDELSLHILDIARNSLAAHADLIEISITDQPNSGILSIEISDNGRGMDADLLDKALNQPVKISPHRKIGHGLPIFRQAAWDAGGEFYINSAPGHGTSVRAVFKQDRCKPLGNMGATVSALMAHDPRVLLIYKHTYAQDSFTIRSDQIRELMNQSAYSSPYEMVFVSDTINREISKLYGGIPQ